VEERGGGGGGRKNSLTILGGQTEIRKRSVSKTKNQNSPLYYRYPYFYEELINLFHRTSFKLDLQTYFRFLLPGHPARWNIKYIVITKYMVQPQALALYPEKK